MIAILSQLVLVCMLHSGERFDKTKKETYTRPWEETTPALHSRLCAKSLRILQLPLGLGWSLVLSNEEAYRLASEHNNATSLQHKMIY